MGRGSRPILCFISSALPAEAQIRTAESARSQHRKSELATQDGLLLPPLFNEAMDSPLKQRIVDRIIHCFPVFGDETGNRKRLCIVEFPSRPLPSTEQPRAIAFSVDTAVEEHGPHLATGNGPRFRATACWPRCHRR